MLFCCVDDLPFPLLTKEGIEGWSAILQHKEWPLTPYPLPTIIEINRADRIGGMSKKTIQCPNCKKEIEVFRNPIPTVDIIIEIESKGIILIKRKNPPYGWAIPGGFVDYGEPLEVAAVREAKEETSLDVKLIKQFHTYSDPKRDPRHHSISTVYIARGKGKPKAKDDAVEIGVFNESNLPDEIAFDHRSILRDYFKSIY
jgi:ADP-ribose pyrophosphatase YjhB (NUDIX family)